MLLIHIKKRLAISITYDRIEMFGFSFWYDFFLEEWDFKSLGEQEEYDAISCYTLWTCQDLEYT